MVYVDNQLFPKQMHELFGSNQHNAVPAILGSNSDEGTTLFRGIPELSTAAYEARVRASWGASGNAMLDAYAVDAQRSTKIAQQQMASDRLFAWEMRTWARAQVASDQSAYLYYFTHAPKLDRFGTSLGAFHAAEIAYAFGNIGRTTTPRPSDVAVSRQMVAYWTNFAKTGDPNGPGLVQWPRYDTQSDQALEISATPRIITNLRKFQLDIMDARFRDQQARQNQ